MLSSSPLRLDWCGHDAARYAVLHWHYSRKMPKGKLARIGVWERGTFVGAVIFGTGACQHIAKPYGLTPFEVCELVRIALRKHDTAVSRVISIAVRMMKRQYPRLRLLVSYADTAQGHHGGIYQAAGWLYTGSASYHALLVLGEVMHPRAVTDRYGIGSSSIAWLQKHIDRKAQRVFTPPKHKYILPLDRDIRERVSKLAQPYPKRGRSGPGDTPAHLAGEGGSTPTLPLQPDSEAQ
jgi:hypothetical protein